MNDMLKESLEEHKANVKVLECITPETVKNLYKQLVKEVDEALGEEE